MLDGFLKGGKAFYVHESNIESQRLREGVAVHDPKTRGFHLDVLGGALYASGFVGDGYPYGREQQYKILNYMDVDVTKLRAGRVHLNYEEPDVGVRTLVVTLTDEARAQVNVWLDLMYARDLLA